FNGGFFDIAALRPQSGGDPYIGVKTNITSGSFTGIPFISIKLDNINVQVNVGPSGGTSDALDWKTALGASGAQVTNPDNSTTNIDFVAGLVTAHGVVELQNLFGLVTGALTIDFSTEKVDAKLDATTTLQNATLTMIALSLDPAATPSQTLFFGVNGIGFSITGVPIDYTDAFMQLEVAATVSFGSFIFASATFVFTTGPDIQITPHGSSSTERVSVMEFAVSKGTLFAGAGASVDANKNLVDGTGLTLTDINIAAVLLTDDDPAILQPKTYFALKASGSVQLAHIDNFDLRGTVMVEVNDATVNGARGPPAADFTQLPGGGLSVPTDLVTPKSILIDFSD